MKNGVMVMVLAIFLVLSSQLVKAGSYPMPSENETDETSYQVAKVEKGKIPLLLPIQPDLKFREDGALIIQVGEYNKKAVNVFYALYKGNGFPSGTQTATEEVISTSKKKQYRVLYKLPGTNIWQVVTLDMLEGLSPSDKRKFKSEKKEYKMIGGKLHYRLRGEKQWKPVEEPISIYELEVKRPGKKKEFLGRHFIIYNHETGETIAIVFNYSAWPMTLRRTVYVVTAGGVIVTIGWLIFLGSFMG